MAKQASKKKRVNRKLKRTIRKTLSAVFMITALIVAAIPVQNNVEASSPGTGGTVSGNTEPEIPAVGYGVTEEYVNNEKIKFSVELQSGNIGNLESAFDIVNVGGTYYLQEIYKIGTFKLGSQVYNTLAAYNKSFMASNNHEVTIPGSVVTSYGEFDLDMEAVKKIYQNSDAESLQERYNNLYPSNIIKAGDPDTGEGAVYEIDIRKEDLTVEPLATNVKKVVLDIYACQQQGAVASGKADAPCRAQEVSMIQEGADDKVVYVAYNPVEGSFYADRTRTLRAIADDAFGKNAYPGDSNVIQLNKLVLPDTIAYIGNNSFEGCSGIRSFELTGTVTNIGCQAFKGCTSMQSIKINNLQKIGAEAFANCNRLASITFPSTLDEIGQGAFYDCTSLITVDMSQITGGVIIDDFAFYDCISLDSFNFGSTVYSIGKGCFAVTDNKPIEGKWTKIQLADSASELGDAMFDGRTNIEEVIFPSTYGAVSNSARTSILDDNFFRRCSSLKSVTIPGAYASFGVDVFRSVESDQFYVEGPATFRADADYTLEENYANPRVSAHNARITYKFKYGNSEYFDVAYNYQPSDNNGNPVVDADGNPVKVTDYYLINVATGELEKYTPDPDNNYSTRIVIKANYNGVSVTGVAEGCFDAVKETATELIVEDGTISSIGKNAFKDFIRLQKVHLGNSVKEVGDGAFAGCNQLEDVYFNMDEVKIGKEAFKKDISASPTGLTFHGKIEAGFEPYDWAMQPENELSTAGLRILYMNLPPSNLGTIYDRTSEGENISIPLIFYPIYNYLDADNEDYRKTKAEQLGLGNWEDYSIIKRVEAGAAGDNQDGEYADADDLAYANATKHIVIPAGVTSIDTPKYYGSAENNTNVTTYVQYSEQGKITNSREAIRYASLTNVVDDQTVVPGLFSGWYEDYTPGSEDALEYEKDVKGNDRVESITMFTVESIPDYAFDSCERLEKVDLGPGCKQIGLAPFRGCTSLVEVIGNETIICENDILYTTNEDGSYTLVECLPSRGKNGNAEVSLANDPKLANVSKISESAFIDCKNLVSVNLSGCNYITTIPKDCFKGCYSLRNVVFPGSVNNIAEGAFKGLTQIHVTIPSREVYIHRDAFEHGNGENGTSVGEKLSTVVIQSFPDSAAFRYTEDNYIGFEGYNEDEHSVTFLNWDFSELYRTRVKDGASVRPFLETQTEPSRSGYKFVGWATITNGATLDVITADTIFIAQFNSKGGNNGNGNGNGSTSGNGDGNGNGNGDGNGSGSKMHTVTVINGSGSGSYIEGADVVIAANNPATGYQFKDWTVNTNNATLASNRVAATTFKMPAGDVRVTANYEKSKTSGGSVSGNGSGSGSNSSNKNNNSNSGTKVVITRPGISDTDLASAKVNGSKDGFIVKISETAEATAAVEQALTNKYGSLDNIRYAAMDISLYDSTGTNKITDTTGYTIDITIPIPDVLREYAGNNKTAAVVNAQLENLAPKFTTIDGVPCVTFRATHFSPYTVYVDTGNLTAGGLDSTPKTGDGIHPKWFLAIGLACLSVVLFMKKDKRAPKVKTA